MTNLIVTRHSFFRTASEGNLRYTEHWPPQPHHECKQICNCTREVNERPDGTPTDIGQEFVLHGEGWKFSLGEGWLTFRGDTPDPHAYFIFGPDMKLRAEICNAHAMVTSLEEFDKHVFLGTIYLGNEIDISTLMNGHSYSRIINLSSIGPNDLWTHHCNFGREAFSFITMPEVQEFWRHVIGRGVSVRTGMERWLKDHESSVKDTWIDIDGTGSKILEMAEDIAAKLEPHSRLEQFRKTEFSIVSMQVQKETRNDQRTNTGCN